MSLYDNFARHGVENARAPAIPQDLIDRAKAVDILAVAQQYGARLKKVGVAEFAGPCPVCRAGKDRFFLNAKRGLWGCRGCSVGGDVINFVRHATGASFADAVRQLAGDAPTPERKPAVQREREEARGKVRDAEAARADARKKTADTSQALDLWNEAVPLTGTLADTYLRSRAIVIDDPLAHALRFHPKISNPSHGWLPAMLGLFRDVVTNEPRAISRTYLSPDGAKIDRRFLGRVANCAIKLDPAPTVGRLHIGEGIETALAARILGHEPAWATGSAGAIEKFAVVDGISKLIFLREQDAANSRAAEACRGRWIAAGRQTVNEWPPCGNDFNDALRALAAK
jgi:putative DNA primase/helicase